MKYTHKRVTLETDEHQDTLGYKYSFDEIGKVDKIPFFINAFYYSKVDTSLTSIEMTTYDHYWKNASLSRDQIFEELSKMLTTHYGEPVVKITYPNHDNEELPTVESNWIAGNMHVHIISAQTLDMRGEGMSLVKYINLHFNHTKLLLDERESSPIEYDQ